MQTAVRVRPRVERCVLAAAFEQKIFQGMQAGRIDGRHALCAKNKHLRAGSNWLRTSLSRSATPKTAAHSPRKKRSSGAPPADRIRILHRHKSASSLSSVSALLTARHPNIRHPLHEQQGGHHHADPTG
jgi:hypothetical protein